mmetsp:Transcript_76455/g.151552  ORF Transcript_76455/g.151552 Transcript_76455/m.151552 type:complete len:265 (+) Transcript_76455:467-1261(+)
MKSTTLPVRPDISLMMSTKPRCSSTPGTSKSKGKLHCSDADTRHGNLESFSNSLPTIGSKKGVVDLLCLWQVADPGELKLAPGVVCEDGWENLHEGFGQAVAQPDVPHVFLHNIFTVGHQQEISLDHELEAETSYWQKSKHVVDTIDVGQTVAVEREGDQDLCRWVVAPRFGSWPRRHVDRVYALTVVVGNPLGLSQHIHCGPVMVVLLRLLCDRDVHAVLSDGASVGDSDGLVVFIARVEEADLVELAQKEDRLWLHVALELL